MVEPLTEISEEQIEFAKNEDDPNFKEFLIQEESGTFKYERYGVKSYGLTEDSAYWNWRNKLHLDD